MQHIEEKVIRKKASASAYIEKKAASVEQLKKEKSYKDLAKTLQKQHQDHWSRIGYCVHWLYC